jgi:hypothetical protein
MLSPSKLLILGLVLGVIWVVFRARHRYGKTAAESRKEEATLELVECAQCGSWVQKSCGEKDCPISTSDQ